MYIVKIFVLLLILISTSGCTILGVETESKRTVVQSNEDQNKRLDEVLSRLDTVERRLRALEQR